MSILNSNQRAVIQAATSVDRLIVDRTVEAYDALLRDDVAMYRRLIATALAQTGLPIPIPKKDKPTAVDIIKTHCIRAIADQKGWSFKRTATYLQAAASPQGGAR